MTGAIVELAADTWDKYITDAKELMVVYFWGPACGHCTMFSPTFEAVAAELGDKAGFAKVNCSDQLSVATDCGIRGTPSILIYGNGEVIDRHVGAETKEELVKRITALLAR
jgi:thioredoxin-like negative regulator of GroEL